jgi:serine/threonine protein phosphatase 1
MASIAIGDIHGNVAALDDLLAQVEPTLTSKDTVVFLGDYIDRGRHSSDVVGRILKLRSESAATVITLRGNHEDWLLKARQDHTHHSWLLATDAYSTIESYSSDAANALRAAVKEVGRTALYGGAALPYDRFFDAVPSAHITFFEGLQLFHRTEDGAFVHAGIDPEAGTLERQSPFTLLMGVFGFPQDYSGPPVVVYGHHNNAEVRDGWAHPRVTQWTIGIDTISHGVLTAVRLPERTIVQSARYLLR